MNKVILIGRVGRDAEVKKMPNGEPVCALSLATSEKWKDKGGQQQEKTEWHRIIGYGRSAEIFGEYCKKGTMMMVEGRIETRKYEKDGEEKSIVEIKCDKFELLGGRPAGDGAAPAPAPTARAAPPVAAKRNDKDIPF